MAEENKVVEVEAEEKKAEEKKEEPKKESSFKKFFKNAKAAFDSNVLEDKINATFRSNHTEFDYYAYGDNSLFAGDRVYGTLDGNYLSYLGDDLVPEHSVVINSKDQKAYYATGEVTDASFEIEVDGNKYERKGKKILLNPEVKEVKVIKADKRYFLYEGEDK